MQYEDENDGPGLGTAAAALAGVGLASPMGRPFRKKLADLHSHFGDPFAPSEATMAKLNTIGSTLRSDLAQGTGQLSEIGAKAYGAGPTYRRGFEGPSVNTEGFNIPGTMQNAKDTFSGAKDIARAIAAMASATPAAIRQARGATKLGEEMRIDPEDWKKFLGSRAAKGFSEEALIEMSRYGVSDPYAAALLYSKLHA